MIKKIVRFMDIFVFIAVTAAIGGVFYEGMELKWFDFVGILIILMDYSFLISTIINLIAERKSKWIKIHIFSLILLIAAISMKVLSIPYPSILLVFWYFYIWFLFSIRNAEYYFKRERLRNNFY